LSYFPDDLAIVDWNSAFIYDPRMSWDTLDVLEYANIELLELRTYDSVLDNELDKAYDKMKVKRWKLPLLSPFSSAIQKLEETRLEVTEVTEKVENALKLVGDQYLASVYNTAVEALFLNEWKMGVKDKLEIIDDFYSTLYNKVQTERMLVLDILIVLLIVLEILIAFWPK
jgi:transcription termination factor NusB